MSKLSFTEETALNNSCDKRGLKILNYEVNYEITVEFDSDDLTS